MGQALAFLEDIRLEREAWCDAQREGEVSVLCPSCEAPTVVHGDVHAKRYAGVCEVCGSGFLVSIKGEVYAETETE